MTMRSHSGEINIEVTVKTSELLARLKENRERHAKEFELAIAAWQEELQRAIGQIDPKDWLYFPPALAHLQQECPVSHVNDYEQAIDMFTMCTKEEVTLDTDSFNTFCRDEWGWKSYVSMNRYYRNARLR